MSALTNSESSHLTHQLRRLAPRLCKLLMVAMLGVSPAHAAGVVGTGTPGSCTRAAFNVSLVGGGNITFNCGVAPLTITLTLVKMISFDTTINGGNLITLKASGANHFKVASGKKLVLEDITLTGGNASAAGAIESSGTTILTGVTFISNTSTDKGGAITNHGTLKVKKCRFSQNQAANGGGAIWIDDGGTASVDDSEFDENQTTGGINSEGGAICNFAGNLNVVNSMFIDNSAGKGGALSNSATSTVVLSTFLGNEAVDAGGAIYNIEVLSVDRSTLSGNQAERGGGIAHLQTSLTLTASTLSGNSAISEGGGIFSSEHAWYTNNTLSANQAVLLGGGLKQNGGDGRMLFSTVANNFAAGGAGVYKDAATPGNLTLQNTLLSKNSDHDCDGVVASSGHNIASDNYCMFTGPGDMNGVDPKLGPLANHGGPTKTHQPQPGSPAINGAVMVSGVTTDQRGITRPQGPTPDVGSVEVP